MKILAGLIPRSSGAVSLRGQPVDGPSRDIGIVFQDPVLLPWRTVPRQCRHPRGMGEAQGHLQGPEARRGAVPAADFYTSALLAEINRFDQAAVIRQAQEYKAQ
jgi:ABC-type sugar transport system ATPase subunit